MGGGWHERGGNEHPWAATERCVLGMRAAVGRGAPPLQGERAERREAHASEVRCLLSRCIPTRCARRYCGWLAQLGERQTED